MYFILYIKLQHSLWCSVMNS